NRAVVTTNAVQIKIHYAQAGHAIDEFVSRERFELEVLLLVAIERVLPTHIIVGNKEEAPCATRRVMDGLAGRGPHHVYDGADQGSRGEVLSRAALYVGSVLFEQAFIGVPLHVGFERGPLLLVDQV